MINFYEILLKKVQEILKYKLDPNGKFGVRFVKMKSISDFLDNSTEAFRFIRVVVESIELGFNEMKEEYERLPEDLRIETAAKYLDDAIKFPWYIEGIDHEIFKVLISFTVSALDDQFGHNKWGVAVKLDDKQGVDYTPDDIVSIS